MYRNIHYTYDPDNNWNGCITLGTWDAQGNPKIEKIEHNSTLLFETPRKTGLLSIFNTNVEKKYFKNKKERSKFVEAHRELKIFECKDPRVEFLSQRFIDSYDKEDFAKFPLRVHYIDIEIAVGSDGDTSFPEPREAKQPINLITIYDSIDKKFRSWACGDIKQKHESVELFQFKSEEDLFEHFLNYQQKQNPPDVYCGWNSLKFDVPYLYNRAVRLFGEETANKLSP
jgi:DNA polymerase elongation subunit (family B)